MTTELNTYGNSFQEVVLQRSKAEMEYNKLVAELHESELYLKVQDAQKKVREYQEAEDLIKSNILEGMRNNSLKTLEFTDAKFTVKQNPASLKILDNDLVPSTYKQEKTTVTTVIDKAKIKEDLKAGVEVAGCELSYSYSLVITPKGNV